MEIRKLARGELSTALDLVWQTFLCFEAPDYSEAGCAAFHAFITDPNIESLLEFFGAFEGDMLTGVIAVCGDRQHISLFFVAEPYQRKGIGRALWHYVLEHSDAARFTVNSSPYAVPIYHKLGFADEETEQEKDGIRYTPMVFARQV